MGAGVRAAASQQRPAVQIQWVFGHGLSAGQWLGALPSAPDVGLVWFFRDDHQLLAGNI
jgi:hypothetical protein